MFGLFKTVILDDPQLGPLKRSGKRWCGKITFEGGPTVELEIDGTRDAPFPNAIAAAYQLPTRYNALKPEIAKSLFDHLEPYQEAVADPEIGDEVREHYEDPSAVSRIEKISTPQEAFANAILDGVEIGMDRQTLVILIRYQTLWDQEHIVGAYYHDWVFQELNGSV